MKHKCNVASKKSIFNIFKYDRCLSDSAVETQCRAVRKYPSVINLIELPSSDAIKIANTQCPGVFWSKAMPTDDQLVELMIESPVLIQHLRKASPRVIDAAVIAFNGHCYDPEIKVTAEMITNAVSQCGMLLGLIRYRTEERCYLAICNDIEAIQWIDRPSKRIIDIASSDINGLMYMFGTNRHWTPLTAQLIGIAREKLNDYSVVLENYFKHDFRRALFSLISKEDALFYLDFDWMYDIINAEDFIKEPCDEVKMKLLGCTYRCIDEYQKHAPKHWKLSEKIQLIIATMPDEILSLKNPCLKARVAGIESIAGVAMSGRNVFDDEICKKALNNAAHKSGLRKIYKLIKSPSLSVRMHYRELLRIAFPVLIKPRSIPTEINNQETSIIPPASETKSMKQVEIEEIPF